MQYATEDRHRVPDGDQAPAYRASRPPSRAPPEFDQNQARAQGAQRLAEARTRSKSRGRQEDSPDRYARPQPQSYHRPQDRDVDREPPRQYRSAAPRPAADDGYNPRGHRAAADDADRGQPTLRSMDRRQYEARSAKGSKSKRGGTHDEAPVYIPSAAPSQNGSQYSKGYGSGSGYASDNRRDDDSEFDLDDPSIKTLNTVKGRTRSGPPTPHHNAHRYAQHKQQMSKFRQDEEEEEYYSSDGEDDGWLDSGDDRGCRMCRGCTIA
uniref:Uncharacterized protein n=1 Tax=Eutreptiella gymnastica TaxID=73025 RepID=A0A7S1I8E0_9EUGL|mmetsp:Transcript_13828/g.24692  ORF Transcript_13828/g.24692 Transcript_13828/m.24692 type:complete len:266 (+) Transcript_13828:64-861(+)